MTALEAYAAQPGSHYGCRSTPACSARSRTSCSWLQTRVCSVSALCPGYGRHSSASRTVIAPPQSYTSAPPKRPVALETSRIHRRSWHLRRPHCWGSAWYELSKEEQRLNGVKILSACRIWKGHARLSAERLGYLSLVLPVPSTDYFVLATEVLARYQYLGENRYPLRGKVQMNLR